MFMKSFKKFLLCFLALTLVPLIPPAQSQTAAPALSLENYALPKTLGKIEERFVGTSDRWVIQIQDVHAHFAAQENISAIVDHLNAVYGIHAIGIEGGWNETSFKESWGLPSSREKQMLARGLMEKHHITGAAYAALFSQSPLLLTGVEERKLYIENRDAYLKYLDHQGQTFSLLDTHEKKLQAMKLAYNPELKSFDAALASFRDGKKAVEFLPLVIKEASAKNVALEDLKQVLLFKKILQMEAGLDTEKLEAEAARLMKEFKRERLSFEELLKSGSVTEEKIGHYPASKSYLALLREQENLSYRDFFSEMSAAIFRIKEKLYVNDEERALDRRWENFLIARQVATLRATPEDLANFEAQKSGLQPEIESAGLTAALETALEFYKLARDRDQVFFGAMMKNPVLSKGNSIIIAGGFHTAAISRKLKEAGVSFLVITPDLQGEAPDEKLYHERLKDLIPEAQTLAQPALFLAPEFDAGFRDGILVVQRDKNVFKGVATVLAAMSGPGRVAASPSVGAGEKWDMAQFTAMKPEEKLAWVKTKLEAAAQLHERMFLVVKGSVFTELLAAGGTDRFLPLVTSDRNNTVVVVYEESASEIPMELIGSKSQLKRLQGKTLTDVSEQVARQFKDAIDDGRVAVMAPDEEEVAIDALRLKIHPVSLLYRLFLSSPEMRLAAQNPAFLDELRQVLLQIESLDAIMSAA